MRLFKPIYKNKRGKYTEVKKYWIEVVDRREKAFRKVLRFPAFESKELSKKLGENIQELIDYATMNKPCPKLIEKIQNDADMKLQDRLIELDLLPTKEEKVENPLLDYLPDFQKSIYDESKRDIRKKLNTKDDMVKITCARVRKLIKGCGFVYWTDVTVDEINSYIESRPDGMSQQTAHFYIQAIKRFAKWMYENGYIDKPLEHQDEKGKVKKIINVPTSKNKGRAFELEEFERLLKVTKNGSENYGLTGYQRYILYLLACETGLRRGELRSLTVASVDLKNSCVFVKGGISGATKNKDDAIQYFTPETRILLKEYIKGKMPNVQLFMIHKKSAKMIQDDCKKAKIEIHNHKGKLNFHSLRHTCGSYLAAQGVEPKVIMETMRHKNIDLTMSRYAHLLSGQKKKAMHKFPRFGKEKSREKTA